MDTSTKSFWGRLAFDFGLVVGQVPSFYPMGDDWAMFFNKIWTGLHPISDKANEIPIRLHETHFYISKQFYDLAKIKGLIVDGSEGGLVFGPSHANGGVQLLVKDNYGFRIGGEMEGGEYLINPVSVQEYNDRIIQINCNPKANNLPSSQFNYPVPNNITTIKPKLNQVIEFSFLGQFIINRAATKQHLQELEEINHYQHIKILHDMQLHTGRQLYKPPKKWYQFWK